MKAGWGILRRVMRTWGAAGAAMLAMLVVPTAAMGYSWADESAMRNTSEGRNTFIYDPGVGDTISRQEFVQAPLRSYYGARGFDENFLYWAPLEKEKQLSGANWAGCENIAHSGPCPAGSVHFNTVGAAVGSGRITVLHWKGAFIATVCGNFSENGGAGPMPEITGVKYEDMNGNGKRDGGEPGLSGWTIKLRYEGSVVATTTTDADGSYAFRLNANTLDLGAGEYEVEEVLKPGWVASQTPGALQVPFGAEDTTYSGRNFGNFRPATIAGHKFDDSDVDGAWDIGEVGLPEWAIQLSSGEEDGTDGEGAYSFSVRPGTYTVNELLREGWRQTTPGGSGTHTFTVTSGQIVNGADFGNVCLGGASVTAVDESTEAPVPMEMRIEEVSVPGILENEPSLPRTTTGSEVAFGELLPGTYRITAFLPEGVFTTDPDAVPVEGRFAIVKEVTVPECKTVELSLSLFTHSTPGLVTGGAKIEVPDQKFATSGFRFDGRRGTPSGTLQYVDHGTGLNLHTSMIEGIDVSGEVAIIWGKVQVAGEQQRFRLRLVDAGEPGTEDRFELTLADGYGRGQGQTLIGGNVQIHKN
jgi:hypothetical protein